MPPKVQLCLCKSHGCADTDRMSGATGQVLKGRYLGAMEFRAHQRDEKSAKRSACNPTLGAVENTSNLKPATFPPSSPSHPSNTPPIHALCHHPAALAAEQSHDEGNPCNPAFAGQMNASTTADTQEHYIMQAIESCRLAFQLWQCANIPCDELVFDEIPSREQQCHPNPPLRVDIMSNTQFIEYETRMFSLLDQIDKIKTGDHKECHVAKKNVLSSVEDEVHRLQGLKLHAWKNRAMDGSSDPTVPVSYLGSLKINTGT